VRVRRRLSMVSGASDVQLVVFLVPGRYESLITSVQYTSSPSLIAMVPCVLLKRRRQRRQKQKLNIKVQCSCLFLCHAGNLVVVDTGKLSTAATPLSLSTPLCLGCSQMHAGESNFPR
jgi:hypothetical protein